MKINVIFARLPSLMLRAWLLAIAATCLITDRSVAATVWDGPSMSFTNILGSDPTLPSSQDRLTPNVWITRGALRGIYNAKVETSYAHFSSPIGTQWAYGELANYASLSYQNWETWNGHHPPNMVGQDAVLHLIADDTYLAIRFTSWGQGAGGFSYVRSTESVPEPQSGCLLLSGLMFACGIRYFRGRPQQTRSI